MDSSGKAAAEAARRQIELQKIKWEASVVKINEEKERKEIERKRLIEEKKREEARRRLEEIQEKNRKIMEEEQKARMINTTRSDILETDVNVS